LIGLGKLFHKVSKIDQCQKEEPCKEPASTYLVLEANPLSPSRAFGSSVENPVALEKERSIIVVSLQNNALLLLLLLGQESGTCGVFEDFSDTLVGLC